MKTHAADVSSDFMGNKIVFDAECAKRTHMKGFSLPESRKRRRKYDVWGKLICCNDCIPDERTDSPSSAEVGPDVQNDSPSPDRFDMDSAALVAVLRDLLADTLNGTSFLTHQMVAVRECLSSK